MFTWLKMRLSKENHRKISQALQQFTLSIREILQEDNVVIGMAYADGEEVVGHIVHNDELEWDFAAKGLLSISGQYHEYFGTRLEQTHPLKD